MHHRCHGLIHQRKKSSSSAEDMLSNSSSRQTIACNRIVSPNTTSHNNFTLRSEHRPISYYTLIRRRIKNVKKKQIQVISLFWTFIIVFNIKNMFVILTNNSFGLTRKSNTIAHPKILGCYFSSDSHEIVKIKRLPIYDDERYPSKRLVHWTTENEEFEKNLRNSMKYSRAKAEEVESEQCKLPHKWQSNSYPTCNQVHESDFTLFFNEGVRVEERLRLIDNGFFRDVWSVKEENGVTVVLKNLRHSHQHSDRNFDRHRRDALVMMSATASKYVADIYSFCGSSTFSEYASNGTISDIIWPLNGENCTKSSKEKLELAVPIAHAIQDIHSLSIAHTDITPSQFLVFDDGKVKLNDFNRCRFITRDKNDKPCAYQVHHNPGKYRSPEEYNYTDQNEMVDVYSTGNILYSLLTEAWPFEKNETKDAQKEIKQGGRPFLPDFSTDPVSNALANLVRLCWRQNPDERPSGSDMVNILDNHLSDFNRI